MQPPDDSRDLCFEAVPESQPLVKRPWAPYVFPFVLFIALTAPAGYFPNGAHLLYAIKTLSVGLLLWFWRRSYAADLAPGATPAGYLTAAAAGLILLPLWILPETIVPQFGDELGFDPYSFGCPPAAVPLLIGVRLAGAVVVAPIMEELFWRSFLLRYLIHTDFQKVAIGTFTFFSFTVTFVLFGLEHHRWIQGMIAGAVYTLLVYRQKSLRGAILAHGVTNLSLGLYVIATQRWEFW